MIRDADVDDRDEDTGGVSCTDAHTREARTNRFLVNCPFFILCYVYKFTECNYAKPGKIS